MDEETAIPPKAKFRPAKDWMPQGVLDWIHELGMDEEKVSLSITADPLERDYEREVRERSGWKLYKPPTHVTVTIQQGEEIHSQRFAMQLPGWQRAENIAFGHAITRD